jgi:hypothetical protein
MNISLSDVLLLTHAALGGTGIFAAIWVFVETLNASELNAVRINRAAWATALFMGLAWMAGGYWYTHYYPADKAVILKGPWPWAHSLFMETKEHLFFLTLILAFYLPIACADRPHLNAAARRMVLTVAALIVLTGLWIEGAGAIINHGAKIALARARLPEAVK